jgi:hypothetical protein
MSAASLRLNGKFGIFGCGSSRKKASFSGVKSGFSAIAANGVVVRGLSPAQQLQRFATPDGAIYVVLLLLFAAMPLLADRSSAT